MWLERLEQRLALSATTASLDPSAYAPGTLLIKLREPAATSLQTQSAGDEVFGIASLSSRSYVESPLVGLPTSVQTVLSGFGATGLGRVFPTAPQSGEDNTLFGISSLSVSSFSASTTPTPAETTSTSQEIGLDRWFRIDLPADADLDAVMASLQGDASIAAVEPDFLFRMAGAASDAPSVGAAASSPNATAQASAASANADTWHLDAVNTQAAWDHLVAAGKQAGGSSDIVVAVIDTGVDYAHPDLAANMWVNTQEIPGNNRDDDGNGIVDDIHGASFVSNTWAHSGNPMDDHAHGTHVAGIIAAANNGFGATGIAFNSKIMAIKALQYSGIGTATDIAEAIYYAIENGADIINMSFGSYSESGVIKDALEVAFGQAVLIAAAGNDGVHNEVPPVMPPPRPMYPAAYNWVVGVQATNPTPNLFGNYRAGFSNWDSIPGTRKEYEVAAPGVDIYSTIPNNGYAAWDGTSMAAPIVSGIASLLRAEFADKDVYSSRFIMGQLVVGGVLGGQHIDRSEIIDAARVLTDTPKPDLTYLDHWIFDTASQAAGNDADGRVDAGETIDLAITLKNRWGKADNVQVTLEAFAAGAVSPDPYVTIDTGTVNYGAIGSFNEDDNGLIYDDGGLVTGVNSPFRFTVSPDAPNEHVIPFRLTITATNGLDPNDTTIYQYEQRFTAMVQRGRELPSIITEDMTLTKDDLWIVAGPVLVPEGVTLRVDPGTHVQWGTTQPRDPYAVPRIPYLKVEGTLIVQGSFEEPVQLYPSELFREENNKKANVRIFNIGTATVDFANINSPEFGRDEHVRYPINDDYFRLTSISRSVLRGRDGENHSFLLWDNSLNTFRHWDTGFSFAADNITESIIDLQGTQVSALSWHQLAHNMTGTLVTEVSPRYSYSFNAVITGDVVDTVFLGQEFRSGSVLRRAVGDRQFLSNAILNPYSDPNVANWLGIAFNGTSDTSVNLEGNYWGTSSKELIDIIIHDRSDDFNLGTIIYEPFLTVPSEQTYPFVVSVDTSVDGTGSTSRVGPEPVTFTVTYNRDMDMTVQPQVSFGPDTPLTDYTVHPINGGWQDARTWVGTFNITPLTGDGYQLIRVAGARAADKPWLVTGDDKGRFRFEIITSGAEAMNLQASGGESKVDLSWVQDDFELLAGYNIYRSTSLNGSYTRINPTLIPADVKSYVDTGVQPAVTYFYKFRVAKTDGTESGDSNITSAAPLDTIPPAISHTPVGAAAPNFDFTLRADVTDNLAVQSVTLHYRAIGATAFSTTPMTKTTGNRYSTTLDSTVMTAPGIEYFISATDGVTTVYNGLAANPHEIAIIDAPAITSITPATGPVAGGTSVTIVGSNFKPGASVTIGGAPAANVVIVNSNQITATTPARFAAAADVVVTNPDNADGVLLNGFTYVSDGVVVSMPSLVGDTGDVVEVPISLSNVQGLRSAELTISFDSTVLSAQSARIGALSNGWALEANAATPGQIVISAAGATAVSATGVIAYVQFNVVGAAQAQTALTVASASLNDGAISTESANGLFTVGSVFSVAGTVRYYSNAAAVAGAALFLENSAASTTTTTSGADGQFAFDSLRRDAYTLTATKQDDVREITAYDASLVLRSSVGLTTLTSNQRLAADVNRSGSVTALDAAYILERSVGLISGRFPGAGTYWDFVPAERTFADLASNRTGQDFTAVLIGDVSGNWLPADSQGGASAASVAPGQTISPNSTATLSLETLDILPGTSLPLPLILSRGNEELYSLDAWIEYDPAAVSIAVADITAGVQDGSMIVVANIPEPGKLRLAIASSRPLPDQQAIATLNFTVTTLASETPVTIRTARLDEGRVATVAVGGGFAALEPVETDGDIKLSRNRSGFFFANNQRLKFRGQPVQAQVAAWSLLGAEVVAGTNIAFVRHSSGALHRWRLDSQWSFGEPFAAISNAESRILPASARQASTSDESSTAAAFASLIDIEDNGLLNLQKNAEGVLFANGTQLTRDGQPVTEQMGGEASAIGAERMSGVNTLLGRSAENTLVVWRFDDAWRFLAKLTESELSDSEKDDLRAVFAAVVSSAMAT